LFNIFDVVLLLNNLRVIARAGLRPALAKTCTEYKKEVFFTLFHLGGGWAGKPDNPQKNTSFCVRHAKGMRACTHGATHRSDNVARSTPTAQQKRPKNQLIQQ